MKNKAKALAAMYEKKKKNNMKREGRKTRNQEKTRVEEEKEDK